MPVMDLIVSLRVLEGRVEELRHVLSTVREASLREPGCLDYRIAQASTRTDHFFLLERWADGEALSRHQQTSHFQQGVLRVKQCCQSVVIQPICWLME